MQVPCAKKWQKETDKLREIALDCSLTEETKWGKPCFTFLGKNIAIVIPLKESCAFSFFKGALLKDPKRILQNIGEHTQAGRWIKFTSVKEIASLQSTLTSYLYEAVELQESGKKVELRKPSEYAIPDELQAVLKGNAAVKAAFQALTPGRRRSYIFHVSSAKQPKTRQARAERCVPMILAGRGFNERTDT
ncbi:MAG: YdeI/OmpD-associated family protein [Acidobacteriota bacterium]